jgi:hypothetical protein
VGEINAVMLQVFFVKYLAFGHARKLRLHDNLPAALIPKNIAIRTHQEVDGLVDINVHFVLTITKTLSPPKDIQQCEGIKEIREGSREVK